MSSYKFSGKYRIDGCLMPANPVSAPLLRVDAPASLPRIVDLRAMCSPVEDQGEVGSCAANAAVGAIEYHQRLRGEPVTDLSRLYVYYNARQMAGREAEDCGTFIHHVMASVMAHGACPEPQWPYIKAMWPVRPNESCYQTAQAHTGIVYAQVPVDTTATIGTLALGMPVVFGMLLPQGFTQRVGRDGLLVLNEAVPPEGGHAMLIVGYDLDAQTWLVRNSWGTGWGDGGHVRIPFAVMNHYAMPSQFWMIGAIAGTKGISLSGIGQGEALAATRAQASADVTESLRRYQASLGAHLNDRLDSARQGFRDRLRGPGAGGGY